jgi:patatin-like phospholipase/acyl hydrolase
MAKYRILSLDGGGIRGLIPAIIMQRVEKEVPGWLDKIDLVAGTSTGGIIALALAHGLKPAAIRDLYYNQGAYIFYRPWWNQLLSGWGLWGARHPNDHLREALKKELHDIQLKDLQKKVLISSFNLNDKARQQWKAKFFHNFERVTPVNGLKYDPDGYLEAVKVALYTSAAPTYLPSVDTFIDGGVAANNPSMAALAQTQDNRYIIDPRYGADPRPGLGNVVMLSLGTGDSRTVIKRKNHNWGYIQWGYKVRLLNILMDGVEGVPDYESRQILGDDRYMRLNPDFATGQNFVLDDTSQLDALVHFAEKVEIGPVVAWLAKNWLAEE